MENPNIMLRDTAQYVQFIKLMETMTTHCFHLPSTPQQTYMTILTLTIPGVHKDVPRHYVKKTFSKLNMGDIVSIVEKPLRNEKTRKCVVVRTKVNPHTENGNRFSSMTHGDCLNVVHTPREPFWKVFKMS